MLLYSYHNYTDPFKITVKYEYLYSWKPNYSFMYLNLNQEWKKIKEDDRIIKKIIFYREF